MALYKDATLVRKTDSEDFERSYRSGDFVAVQGIYKCSVCERERVFDGGMQIPMDHKHSNIHFWELIVKPDDITY